MNEIEETYKIDGENEDELVERRKGDIEFLY